MQKILLWIIVLLKGSSLKSKALGSLRHMANSSPELHDIEITRCVDPFRASQYLCHSEPKYDQGAVTGRMHSHCLQLCRPQAPLLHQAHLAQGHDLGTDGHNVVECTGCHSHPTTSPSNYLCNALPALGTGVPITLVQWPQNEPPSLPMTRLETVALFSTQLGLAAADRVPLASV